MKKVFIGMISVLVFILIVGVGYAAPYLVSDPATDVTDYQVIDNSAAAVSSIPAADGSLYFNLAGITTGAHTISVTACNLWGCSPATSISFTKVIPGNSKNLKIIVVK